MRVILAGTVNPCRDVPGGVETHIMGLRAALEANGIETTLIGWTDRETQEKGFHPVVRAEAVSDKLFSLHLFKAGFLRFPPDAIIHVHRPHHILPFLFRKNPIVCTLHGAHMLSVRLKGGWLLGLLYDMMQRIVLRRANLLIAVSRDTEDYFLTRYPFVRGKTKIIPPAIGDHLGAVRDARAIRRFGPDEKILIYVGRLEKEKQVDKIFRVIGETQYKLLVVGSGRETRNLVKVAPKNVIFIGEVPHEEIPGIISCANALILLSKYEGMPTVVIESLACGVPVLATDVGDVRDVVRDGETGNVSNFRENTGGGISAGR
jgi:glycosyltransferase involved in cell wall biosynthesis